MQATHGFHQPTRAGELEYRARVGQHAAITRKVRQCRAEVLGVVAVLDGVDARGIQRREARQELESKRLGRRRDGVCSADERAFESCPHASRERARHFVLRARGRPFVTIVEDDGRAGPKTCERAEHERREWGSAHEDEVIGPRPSQSEREHPRRVEQPQDLRVREQARFSPRGCPGGETVLALPEARLLSVVQDKAFERVGGNDTIAVDVRVIAATSRDLRAEVEAGRFREDLYYRLNVVHVEMPPLRVRAEDILLLARSFLRHCSEENAKHIDGFTPSAKSKLLGHVWAGNVRELENTIERAVVLCGGAEIDARHLDLEPAHCKLPLQRFADIEREAILSTLAAVSSTARAAEVLGISVRTIQYRLKQYGLTGPRRRCC